MPHEKPNPVQQLYIVEFFSKRSRSQLKNSTGWEINGAWDALAIVVMSIFVDKAGKCSVIATGTNESNRPPQ
jgi:hypothetical protein